MTEANWGKRDTCRDCGKAPRSQGKSSLEREDQWPGPGQTWAQGGNQGKKLTTAGQEAGTEGAVKEEPAAALNVKRIKL
eukprot:3146980-Heterocapsa_arctica.AAC.1